MGSCGLLSGGLLSVWPFVLWPYVRGLLSVWPFVRIPIHPRPGLARQPPATQIHRSSQIINTTDDYDEHPADDVTSLD